jgi:serine/threonine protein kinase
MRSENRLIEAVDSELIWILVKTALPVARKCFPYTPDFDREYKFLQILNASRNRNNRIIKDIAAVSSGDKHSILFPLAELDLAKFLMIRNLSSLQLGDLITEAYNILDAVSWLHSGICTSDGKPLIGCHLDLNPKNILVFLDPRPSETTDSVGIWRITDFSTAILIDEHGERLLPPPRLFSEIYNAPEINNASGETDASTSSDIWSFGCILFEVLLAHVDGKEVFLTWKDRFGNSPCYYEEGLVGRVLGSRVQDWLSEEHGTSHAVHLCIEMISNMLVVEPTKRPTARELLGRLKLVIQRS